MGKLNKNFIKWSVLFLCTVCMPFSAYASWICYNGPAVIFWVVNNSPDTYTVTQVGGASTRTNSTYVGYLCNKGSQPQVGWDSPQVDTYGWGPLVDNDGYWWGGHKGTSNVPTATLAPQCQVAPGNTFGSAECQASCTTYAVAGPGGVVYVNVTNNSAALNYGANCRNTTQGPYTDIPGATVQPNPNIPAVTSFFGATNSDYVLNSSTSINQSGGRGAVVSYYYLTTDYDGNNGANSSSGNIYVLTIPQTGLFPAGPSATGTSPQQF